MMPSPNLPAEISGDQTQEGSHRCCKAHNHESHEEGDSGSVDNPAQEISSQGIGAKEMGEAGGLETVGGIDEVRIVG